MLTGLPCAEFQFAVLGLVIRYGLFHSQVGYGQTDRIPDDIGPFFQSVAAKVTILIFLSRWFLSIYGQKW